MSLPLPDTGLGGEKHGVKMQYGGFTSGSCSDIYNPWSIAFFIRERIIEYDK
ncbi:MAG: hypothetical protein K2G55_03380 [Lachnospiraceae bacterium]|nr:hypothetical protein [Lachnospiraceae bacterium]